MVRTALPKNYVKNNGTTIDDFNDPLLYTTTGSPILEEDTINYKQGNKALKITVPTGGTVEIVKNININLATGSLAMVLPMFLYNDPSTISSMQIQFSSVSDFSKYVYVDVYGINKYWNEHIYTRTEFTKFNNEQWSNTMVKMKIKIVANAGQSPVVTFDHFRHSFKGVPKILINFDDALISEYTEGVLYMYSKGLKGTMYVPSGDVGDPGYMTLANLQDTYAKGWALGNHTTDQTNLSTLSTVAQNEEKLKPCTDWLIANGFTRGAYHVAYPQGAYTDNTLTAMKNLGMRTGRTTHNGQKILNDKYLLPMFYVKGNHTVAQVKGVIDNAFIKGCTVTLIFHKLVNSVSDIWTEYLISDFREIIDYIAHRRIKAITIDEWEKGLDNPRI